MLAALQLPLQEVAAAAQRINSREVVARQKLHEERQLAKGTSDELRLVAAPLFGINRFCRSPLFLVKVCCKGAQPPKKRARRRSIAKPLQLHVLSLPLLAAYLDLFSRASRLFLARCFRASLVQCLLLRPTVNVCSQQQQLNLLHQRQQQLLQQQILTNATQTALAASNSDNKAQLASQGRFLQVARVKESDAGLYECVASNQRDADLRKLVNVKVRGK